MQPSDFFAHRKDGISPFSLSQSFFSFFLLAEELQFQQQRRHEDEEVLYSYLLYGPIAIPALHTSM
jgi:hypothetical protein